ncbi:Oidioi.mRNA.OKI2018_I69.chr2.g4657.t1.cds [Oikopleura dioica]|uniref:Oidioi.mRNA.OKI2018_I69.chr2.g4657.t1.cds n=1 Tax=Oikopleura dioica TaxID=34765 RepID=A0ABN7SY12_OIKDI|nr:Oidioi.mRNA.OKI2018_I69.chr2.g4657.t1.cds [Oikopleura dioica]
MNPENTEINYEDPGSVKDIRKRFGTRTSTEFIKPKNPSVCARAEQNNYTKAWQEIINEGFREAEKTIDSSFSIEKENQTITKPVKPPKPARTVSKALGRPFANTNVKTTPELLTKINEVMRKNAVIKDFEAAVSEFYKTVREFESMKK